MSFFAKKELPAEPTTTEPEPGLKRPGTSATEMALTTSRKAASAQLQAAQKAERAYRAKKRAAIARANWVETRTHFRESATHGKQGLALIGSVIRSLPYFWTERQELGRAKSLAVKRQRAADKRKKLEEKLAREAALDQGDEAVEAVAAPATP